MALLNILVIAEFKAQSSKKLTDFSTELEPIPILFVVYTNDAVLVEYSDESRLQLSPCGTVFEFDLPPTSASVIASNGSRTIKQKCEFATSLYRAKVAEAVRFRNLFASRPCLLASLMQQDGEWAADYGDNKDFDASGAFGNGRCFFYWPAAGSGWQLGKSTKFSSIDGQATLTVSPNGQDICAEFYSGLSTTHSSNSEAAKEERFRSTVMKMSLIPSEDLPDCWRIPVSLALGQAFDPSAATNSTELGRLVQLNGELKAQYRQLLAATRTDHLHGGCAAEHQPLNAVATPRPIPVPRRCRHPHLHGFGLFSGANPTPPSGLEWLTAAALELRPVRVVCRDGVVYRLSRRGSSSPAVLVQPGDGSALISRDLRGAYFERVSPDGSRSCCRVEDFACRGGASEGDRLLAEALERASALCSLLAVEWSRETRLSAPACCWSAEQEDNVELESELPTCQQQPPPSQQQQLLDCRIVPGVGRFSVSSNGRARIKFNDRVQLDYLIELRPDLLRTSLATSAAAAPPRDLPTLGFCRLLTRQGHELTLSLSEPPSLYASYARAAVEWSMWLNSSNRDRFYEVEFAPSPEETRLELVKIRQALANKEGCAEVPDVEAALRRTRRFLGEEVD